MARRRKSSTRRRRTSSVKRVFSRRTGGGIVSTVKPMAQGIGGGVIGETVAVAVGQSQFAQIAGYGGSYLFGGVKGVLGKVIFDVLSGKGFLSGFGLGQAKSVEASV